MTTLRHSAVAGSFYPDDPRKLAAMVESFLAAGSARLAAAAHGVAGLGRPKAIIAPHAGYVYSGPVAGTAFAMLRKVAPGPATLPPIERAVVIGPSHHVAFAGIAVPSATAFATPLGPVPVDRAVVTAALELPCVHESDRAHAREHALEVELPFLIAVAPAGVKIVPLVVGAATIAETARLLERLWGGPETVIIVSSDLSHYLPYHLATGVDAETAELIVALAADRLSGERACGYQAVRGLLETARRRHLHATLLDLRNSGDTAGARDHVVGYGAFAFHEQAAGKGRGRPCRPALRYWPPPPLVAFASPSIARRSPGHSRSAS